MKRIYLVRHCRPELPGNDRYCLGRADFPLCAEGRAQAEILRDYFAAMPITAVWCSTLSRARETADILSGGRLPVREHTGLDELSCGEWDGLPFDEIRRRWPELYAARGSDLSLPPPGGESASAGAVRALAALREIVADTDGDAAVITHKGLLSVLLTHIFAAPATLPYGSITVLLWDGNAFSLADAAGQTPAL